MSSSGLSLPKRPALGLTEEHKRRIMQAVHGMLPSEDWAGWERLGWEDEDEYQARMSRGGTKKAHRKSWSNGSPEGKSFLRELDSDAMGLHHTYVRKRPSRRRTVSEGVVAVGDGEGMDEDDLEEEVQEEPEYLFPNKTPRAALSRHQSYMVTQEAFEREKKARRRSGSFSSNKSRKSTFSQPGSDMEDSDGEGVTPGRAAIPTVGPAEAATSMPPASAVPTVVMEGLRKSQNGKKLITYEDLPPWMQNNEYIVTGYR
jgi:adiponectin receptor